MLTWEKLLELEPKLKSLCAAAQSYHANVAEGFCANQVWYGKGGLKEKMCKLVGFDADGIDGRDERIYSKAAYDLAYEEIYAMLPNCNHEGAFC